MAKADYIIHLAGAGVMDKRWTKKKKKEIVDSRKKGLIGKMKEKKIKGWYGKDDSTSANKDGFKETAPSSEDFLGQTCKQWERSIEPVTQLNKRLRSFARVLY